MSDSGASTSGARGANAIPALPLFSLRLDHELEIGLYERRHIRSLHDLVVANREHLRRFMPWAEHPSLESTGDFVERSLEQFARGDGFQGGVWFLGDLIGGIGIFNTDRYHRRTEIGYWLAAHAEGKGLMGRAIGALLRYLFEVEDMNRLEIRARSDNQRSRTLAKRLGFSQDGTLRQQVHEGGAWHDHVVYSLLRNEWMQRQEEA